MITDHKEGARELLNDLIEYSGLPEELVRERCKYAVWELAYQWPNYKNPLDFYRNTDLYIYDLTKYQSILVPTVNYMVEMAKKYELKKILDLGGGIGQYTIRLANESKCEVAYLDLKNSKTAEYAIWRFKKRLEKMPPILTEVSEWWNEDWDAVVAMDVIEHMEPDLARKTLKRLKEKARYVFANPENVQYNEAYPQHIGRFTMDGFKHIDINLYKNVSL